jgi:hypothetical protein
LIATIDRLLAALAATGSTMPLPAFVDAVTLLAACGGDSHLLDKMSRSFQANGPVYLDKVHAALQAGDGAALRESAHKLRGLVSAFSTQAAQVALVLEEMGAGSKLAEASEPFTNLAGMVRSLAAVAPHLSVEQLKHLRP